MYPTLSYELAKAEITDRRRQAERRRMARVPAQARQRGEHATRTAPCHIARIMARRLGVTPMPERGAQSEGRSRRASYG
jgi:hypothetical protein